MSYNDQADTLRRLMRERGIGNGTDSTDLAPGPKVFTIASGKGGVGKSCLVANLGAALARTGLRVLLIDGDTGLANLDILLGLPRENRPTLETVLDRRASLQDAIVGVEPNLWLIPAASGLHELRQSGPETRGRLLEIFEECPWEMDIVLVDAGAGIGESVLSLHSPAFESLVILTPEPTSLADAYSLIKCLRWSSGIAKASVIVNQVTDGRQAQATFQKLKEVASRFVDTELEYVGHCQRDEKFIQAVMKRKILLDLDPGAPSVPSLELLTKRISSKVQQLQADRPTGQSWGRLPMPEIRNVQGLHKAPGNTARFWRTLLGEVKT